MRRGVAFVLLLVAAAAPATAAGLPTPADVAVVHLDGRGHGHGVGMPQWGAKYAADAGASAATILATFYPGTRPATAGGAVRVRVLDAPGGAILGFPGGGEIRSPRDGEQAPGFPVVVAPGGSVVVRLDEAGYHVDAPLVAQQDSAAIDISLPRPGAAGRAAGARGRTDTSQCIPLLGPCPPGGGNGGGGCSLGCAPTTTTTTTPATTDTTAPPSTEAPPDTAPPPTEPAPGPEQPAPAPAPTTSAHPLWAVPAGGSSVDVPDRGRSYRGSVQAVGPSLRLVNEVDVETYLKGMAEVPSSWPAAAQQAQAIAARTWVLRAMAASGEVCDDDRCQVYVGAAQESAAQSAAVEATRGQVLTFGGGLAATVYSADAGGVTARPSEGFGTNDGAYPYLTNVTYDTPDPLPWAVDAALTDIAARFGYAGTVTDVRVGTAGPSGRALEVVLDGSAGPRPIPGRTFASRLGLRSTLFTARVGTAEAASALGPELDGSGDQLLPDDAAGLGATMATPAQAFALDGSAWARSPDPRSYAPRSVAPVEAAARPATWLAVGLLGAVTAAGMARFGGLDAVTASVITGPRVRPRAGRPSSRSGPRRAPRRPGPLRRSSAA